MARVTESNIKEFQEKLIHWYKQNGRKFPWRKQKLSAYKLIIAEVLLQRTKADNVNKFYARFIKDFPNWKSLNNSRQKKIENYLVPLGLFRQRSKRLISLAKEMSKRKGRLPKSREDLDTIPFMGQYIANAVELLVFKKRNPLIDVNMSRVLERYFGERKMADIRYDPYLQDLSKRIVNHTQSKILNWAVLDFAALVCKSRNPLCKTCVFASKCRFLAKTL